MTADSIILQYSRHVEAFSTMTDISISLCAHCHPKESIFQHDLSHNVKSDDLLVTK